MAGRARLGRGLIVVSDTVLAAYITVAGSLFVGVIYKEIHAMTTEVERNSALRTYFTGEELPGEGELTRIEEEFQAVHSEIETVTEEQARHREERVEEHERVLDLVHGIHQTQCAIAEALNDSDAVETPIKIHEIGSERLYPDGSDGALKEPDEEWSAVDYNRDYEEDI